MDRKRYYIAVGSGEIHADPTVAAYEYEIEANEEEIERLHQLFEKRYKYDENTFLRAHLPYLQYHYDEDNDRHDAVLYDIYRMIYELGTPETRQQMEEAQILQNFPTENP